MQSLFYWTDVYESTFLEIGFAVSCLKIEPKVLKFPECFVAKKDDRSRLEISLFYYSSEDKYSSSSITEILSRFAPSSLERSPSFIKLIIIIFFPCSTPSNLPSVIA